ncbi:hypothetical protein ABXN37_13780 [Piscinibacter sakaiensis]|uniref:hypothetical protein n=1 Tax=Piscinibacter sakaiensis TaxID=1547922 RepID=UPI00372A4132
MAEPTRQAAAAAESGLGIALPLPGLDPSQQQAPGFGQRQRPVGQAGKQTPGLRELTGIAERQPLHRGALPQAAAERAAGLGEGLGGRTVALSQEGLRGAHQQQAEQGQVDRVRGGRTGDARQHREEDLEAAAPRPGVDRRRRGPSASSRKPTRGGQASSTAPARASSDSSARGSSWRSRSISSPPGAQLSRSSRSAAAPPEASGGGPPEAGVGVG